MRRRWSILLLALAAGLLAGCKCDQLAQAVAVAQTVGADAVAAALKDYTDAGCPMPVPTPTPTVPPPTTTTTTTTPGTLPPTPPPVQHAPLIPDEELTAQVPQDGGRVTWLAIEAAIKRWRLAHPEAWRGDGACLINGPAGIDAAFQAISDELLTKGIVAGQSIDRGGKRSDCVFVGRTDASRVYEEAHLFDYSRACVVTGPHGIKGTWVRNAGTTPPPTPPPSACPAPRWESYRDPADAQSCTFVWGDLHVGHRWIDSTLKVRRCCGFCAAIGLPTMPDGVTKRCECPLRAEGDAWHAEHVACDAEVGQLWQARGGTLVPNPDNAAQANCEGAGCQVRICTKSGVCSEWKP